MLQTLLWFLISNFRRVLNVVCFLLGNSPASEFYMPTFRNTLFHLHRQVGVKNELGLRNVGVLYGKKFWLENSLSQTFSLIIPQHFSNLVHSSHLPPYEDGIDNVPKRRHIKFRHRGITQKKTYNIFVINCPQFSNMNVLMRSSCKVSHIFVWF
jgi:hypothetical protein